ncbi:hypothetical protein TrRE_jg12629, partial [Triparma retinervis]
MTSLCFLRITSASHPLGTLTISLRPDICPRTCDNFTQLCQREKGYQDSACHRLIKGFMAQMGDYERGDGTGGNSVYGDRFDDENFILKHSSRGVLSMANCGPNTNGSQFFILFSPAPHLDGKHVVFGRVVGEESMRVLDAMERVTTGRGDRPVRDVRIEACGLLEEEGGEGGEGGEEEGEEKKEGGEKNQDEDTKGKKTGQKEVEEEEEEEEEEETADPLLEVDTSKMSKVELRLHKLKLKMNQSRRLNRTEVVEEGLRMTDSGRKEGRKMKKKDREARARERSSLGPASLSTSASDALDAQERREAKDIRRGNFGWEMYNSGTQHRAYEKRMGNMPKDARRDTATYDPASGGGEKGDSASGVARMASELKDRQKISKRRHRAALEGEDVTSINERNKVFNKKIKRVYDNTNFSGLAVTENMEWKATIFSPLDVMLLHDEFGVTSDPLTSAKSKRLHYREEEERYRYKVPGGEDAKNLDSGGGGEGGG